MYEVVFVNEWPWWAGGLALGLFVLLYGFVFNRLTGMSSTLESAIRELRDPVLPKRSISMDLASAAASLAKQKGLDISGLSLPTLTVSASLPPQRLEYSPRWLVLGLLIGSLLGGLLAGNTWAFSPGPRFDTVFPFSPAGQALILLFGGYLVGFGARMAGGCPTGHGLGGLSTLSPASFIAVAGYFVSGIAFTFILRWLA